MINSRCSIVYLADNSLLDDSFLKILSLKYEVKKSKADAQVLNDIRSLKNPIFLVDLSLRDGKGLELLSALLERSENLCLIAVTSHKTVDEAIRVIQMGALDYLNPLQDMDRLFAVIERLMERKEQEKAIHSFYSDVQLVEEKNIFFGKGEEFKNTIDIVYRIAPLPTTVLLYGESGTGKEVIARLIHKKSHVANHPFVAVNLPSIPTNLVESVLFGHEKGSFTSAYRRHQGKFELAHGGTIFLDEIGDLQFDLQAKLLRVLQEGEIERIGGYHPIKVNVRLIAATKKDLKLAVKNGEFRDDLFYRLNVIPVSLPPLRKRIEDVPGLCEIFIQRYSHKLGKHIRAITPDAIKALKAYRWPGNVRELENLIERIIAMVDLHQEIIQFEDIPMEYVYSNFSESTPNAKDLEDALVKYEKNLILKALRQNNWNRKQTAKALGITYGILKYKIRKFDLKMPGNPQSHFSQTSALVGMASSAAPSSGLPTTNSLLTI